MTECAEIIALLSEFLDQDLPADACARVQSHLESCSECGTAADQLRSTVRLCRENRNLEHPGPLAPDKQSELRAAFEKALSTLRSN
jgi:anti-sigma factor RsiW